MQDFRHLFTTDEWNHQLYAAILQQFTAVPCIQRVRMKTQDVVVPVVDWRRWIKKTLVSWYTRIAGVFTRRRDAFLLATYLPIRDEVRMYRRLGQWPQLWRSVPPVRIAVDDSQRQWQVNGENRSEFETCARALIPQQIPAVYLEGYEQLTEQAAALPWPKQPKVIWTSNSYSSDEVFKAWAGEKVERGSPLVIGQHGGHYGVGRWSFAEDHEIAISDSYLSWGWTEATQPKVESVGQLSSKQPLRIRHAEQPGALLVTCAQFSWHFPYQFFLMALDCSCSLTLTFSRWFLIIFAAS